MEEKKFELVTNTSADALKEFYNVLFKKSIISKYLMAIDTEVCIKEVVDKILEKDCEIFCKLQKALKRLDVEVKTPAIEFDEDLKLKDFIDNCEETIDSLNDTLDVLYAEKDWTAAVIISDLAKKLYDQYHVAKKLYKILSSDSDNTVKRFAVKELAEC